MLTDVVVEAAVVALLLALAIQVQRVDTAAELAIAESESWEEALNEAVRIIFSATAADEAP